MSSIKDDLKSFRRSWVHHTGMQIATLSVLAASLSVIVFGLLISGNMKRLLASWGDAVQVTVYLDEGISDERVNELQSQLRAMPEVAEIAYVPREKATENFKIQMANYAPDLLEDADLANPFPASLRVSLNTGAARQEEVDRLDALAGAIQKLDGVEDVSYGQSWLKNYSGFVSALYGAASFLAIILLGGGLFVIGNSIRSSIAARREEIEILELVGATSAMIRRPFIVEGAVMGVLAAAFALISNYFVHLWLKSVLGSSIVMARVVAQLQFLDFSAMIAFVVVGSFIGALGATLTVCRINDGWSAKQGLEV